MNSTPVLNSTLVVALSFADETPNKLWLRNGDCGARIINTNVNFGVPRVPERDYRSHSNASIFENSLEVTGAAGRLSSLRPVAESKRSLLEREMGGRHQEVEKPSSGPTVSGPATLHEYWASRIPGTRPKWL